jgi:hypothetical protein
LFGAVYGTCGLRLIKEWMVPVYAARFVQVEA